MILNKLLSGCLKRFNQQGKKHEQHSTSTPIRAANLVR